MDEVGLILMIVGMVGLVLSVIYTAVWASNERRYLSQDRYGRRPDDTARY
jgi:hypothetical protein